MHEDMVGSKYYAIQEKANKDTDLLDSVAFKIWNNQFTGYKLVREEGKVKLYERILRGSQKYDYTFRN